MEDDFILILLSEMGKRTQTKSGYPVLLKQKSGLGWSKVSYAMRELVDKSWRI